MSQVPTTPPEISSRDDTPADSLLARLRRITGQAEAELPPPPEEDPVPGPPPVDRLMEWLKDVICALAALGIAAGAALALAGLWIWEHTLEGRVYSRSWQKRTAERKARQITAASFRAVPPAPPAPGQEKEEGASPSEPAIPAEAAAAPAAPPVPEVEEAATVIHDEVIQTEQAAALADEPEKAAEFREVIASVDQPALPRPRTRRKAVAVTAVVLAAAPALLLVPGVRYYFTSLLGWGNATVVVGETGWLFPRAETLPGAVNASALLETAAALREGGAQLVLVSVPAKPAVYPHKREASAGEALTRPAHLAPALQKLTETGAAVLDLGPVLHALKSGDNGDTVFRPQSSRWSPRAVEQAAASVAAFVQQQPGYASLPLRPFQPSLSRISLSAPGDDLAAAFDSRRFRDAHPPQPLHLIRLLDPAGKPLAADPASPVLLIGGDDVRLYDDPSLTPPPAEIPAGQQLSAGFAQYLALYLSSPLDVRTVSLSTAAAREWLSAASPPDRSAKKFIIWLVPDAELAP